MLLAWDNVLTLLMKKLLLLPSIHSSTPLFLRLGGFSNHMTRIFLAVTQARGIIPFFCSGKKWEQILLSLYKPACLEISAGFTHPFSPQLVPSLLITIFSLVLCSYCLPLVCVQQSTLRQEYQEFTKTSILFQNSAAAQWHRSMPWVNVGRNAGRTLMLQCLGTAEGNSG